MRVYFSITGPGPGYAHRIAPPSQRANAGTFKPYPSRYRAFVQAVGTRYNGRYRDENGIRKALPRVALWSLWNEPNQPGWLSPQWENGVPASPALYRELYHAGHQGLELSGHGERRDPARRDVAARLVAEAARATGSGRSRSCASSSASRRTARSTRAPTRPRRQCDDFARIGQLKATAYAHHPYTKKGAPTVRPSNPDDITIANIGLLGGAARHAVGAVGRQDRRRACRSC